MPVSTANEILLRELRQARIESDRFFNIIRPDAIYDRPIDARHRILFYVGHLDGFDSIQICRRALGMKSIDPELDTLFEAGIDPDSSHLPTDTPSDWPSVEEVQAYVKRCRQHVDEHLDQASDEVLNMALEHRMMHLETLAYMFHNLEFERKSGPAPRAENGTEQVPVTWCNIPEGTALLGKAQDGQFAWDNEFEQHSQFVPAFRMQRYSVTNGRYLDFVRKSGAVPPHFWSERSDGIYLRCMFGELPLPLDWPVYVSNAEAQAYARAHGWRLPSEAEYHRAVTGTRQSPKDNVDFRSWDPMPVDSAPESRSLYGVEQLIGNGWEWTSTPFGPFPGFKPRPSYPGYSANFFDGDHFVLKGGSARTAARLLRPSFRNWFRKDYPYMYAKFRCVESE
ncbi:MAG TPA: SUMF1/EgtB/PvdO family nonheme iron enzyme [Bryobacteraceae bacterium]|jgi:formylglycine-generating enzyme required for sulfatase activity|nr:SUMF1/EgtB/PvdO family nonheme iron enzyme [Bryobacteraceae bacterium]